MEHNAYYRSLVANQQILVPADAANVVFADEA